MRARLGSTFRSLRVRNYRLFATGQVISLTFNWVQITAQDWLVLHLSHDSGTALGLVTALQFTPILLLSLYAGKLADRFDKRRLLVLVNVAWAVLSAAMGLLVLSGTARTWYVLVFAALWGSVTAMENPARQSFVSELVKPELLPNALSLNGATFNVGRVIGPALGGLAIWALGTGPAFMLNAVSYTAPIVGLALMRTGALFRDTAQRRPAADARVVDGLRYVLRRPDLLLAMGLMLVIGAAGFNFQITLALLAKTVFHTGAQSFGLLTTALAVGAVGGALGGAGRRVRPSVWLVLGAGVGFGVLETLVGLGPTFLVTGLLLVPAGFMMIFLAQAVNQRIQLGVEPELRGRVMALYTMVFFGTNPIGAPLVGWVSQTYGPRTAIWAGGLISLTVAVAALAVRLRMAGGRIRLRLRPLPRFSVVLPEVVPDKQSA